MHITKSKKILDLIEMKSRILVIIVGMYCYWYSVTIWNGDSRSYDAVPHNSRYCHDVHPLIDKQARVQVTQSVEPSELDTYTVAIIP